jgi:hypothetical protein
MSKAWHLRRLKARLDLSMKIIHRGGYKKVYPEQFAEVREQMQEDIRTCMEGMWNMDEKHLIEDMLCQIVVDNFKKLED